MAKIYVLFWKRSFSEGFGLIRAYTEDLKGRADEDLDLLKKASDDVSREYSLIEITLLTGGRS